MAGGWWFINEQAIVNGVTNLLFIIRVREILISIIVFVARVDTADARRSHPSAVRFRNVIAPRQEMGIPTRYICSLAQAAHPGIGVASVLLIALLRSRVAATRTLET